MAKHGGDQTRGPLTEEERALILDLAEQGMARNEIARQVGRAAGTVTKIVKAAGLEFDREPTRQATEARQVDLTFMRTLLEQESWVNLGMILKRFSEPSELIQYDRENGFVRETLDKPTDKSIADLARAAKDLATAAKLLADANRETQGDHSDKGGISEWLKAEVDGDALPIEAA